MPLQAHSSVGEHHLDTVGVCGSIPHVPTKTGFLLGNWSCALLAACGLFGCKSAPAGEVDEPKGPPRLDAVEACGASVPVAAPLPVPAGPGAIIGFSDGGGFHPGSVLCDLPSRVLVLAPEM